MCRRWGRGGLRACTQMVDIDWLEMFVEIICWWKRMGRHGNFGDKERSSTLPVWFRRAVVAIDVHLYFFAWFFFNSSPVPTL